eukprot:jgi/Bigna1/70738/fgenesh1_pg.13_\
MTFMIAKKSLISFHQDYSSRSLADVTGIEALGYIKNGDIVELSPESLPYYLGRNRKVSKGKISCLLNPVHYEESCLWQFVCLFRPPGEELRYGDKIKLRHVYRFAIKLQTIFILGKWRMMLCCKLSLFLQSRDADKGVQDDGSMSMTLDVKGVDLTIMPPDNGFVNHGDRIQKRHGYLWMQAHGTDSNYYYLKYDEENPENVIFAHQLESVALASKKAVESLWKVRVMRDALGELTHLRHGDLLQLQYIGLNSVRAIAASSANSSSITAEDCFQLILAAGAASSNKDSDVKGAARSSDMKTGRMLVIDEEGKDGGGLDEEMPSGDPLLYRDRTVSNPVGRISTMESKADDEGRTNINLRFSSDFVSNPLAVWQLDCDAKYTANSGLAQYWRTTKTKAMIFEGLLVNKLSGLFLVLEMNDTGANGSWKVTSNRDRASRFRFRLHDYNRKGTGSTFSSSNGAWGVEKKAPSFTPPFVHIESMVHIAVCSTRQRWYWVGHGEDEYYKCGSSPMKLWKYDEDKPPWKDVFQLKLIQPKQLESFYDIWYAQSSILDFYKFYKETGVKEVLSNNRRTVQKRVLQCEEKIAHLVELIDNLARTCTDGNKIPEKQRLMMRLHVISNTLIIIETLNNARVQVARELIIRAGTHPQVLLYALQLALEAGLRADNSVTIKNGINRLLDCDGFPRKMNTCVAQIIERLGGGRAMIARAMKRQQKARNNGKGRPQQQEEEERKERSARSSSGATVIPGFDYTLPDGFKKFYKLLTNIHTKNIETRHVTATVMWQNRAIKNKCAGMEMWRRDNETGARKEKVTLLEYAWDWITREGAPKNRDKERKAFERGELVSTYPLAVDLLYMIRYTYKNNPEKLANNSVWISYAERVFRHNFRVCWEKLPDFLAAFLMDERDLPIEANQEAVFKKFFFKGSRLVQEGFSRLYPSIWMNNKEIFIKICKPRSLDAKNLPYDEKSCKVHKWILRQATTIIGRAGAMMSPQHNSYHTGNNPLDSTLSPIPSGLSSPVLQAEYSQSRNPNSNYYNGTGGEVSVSLSDEVRLTEWLVDIGKQPSSSAKITSPTATVKKRRGEGPNQSQRRRVSLSYFRGCLWLICKLAAVNPTVIEKIRELLQLPAIKATIDLLATSRKPTKRNSVDLLRLRRNVVELMTVLYVRPKLKSLHFYRERHNIRGQFPVEIRDFVEQLLKKGSDMLIFSKSDREGKRIGSKSLTSKAGGPEHWAAVTRKHELAIADLYAQCLARDCLHEECACSSKEWKALQMVLNDLQIRLRLTIEPWRQDTIPQRHLSTEEPKAAAAAADRKHDTKVGRGRRASNESRKGGSNNGNDERRVLQASLAALNFHDQLIRIVSLSMKNSHSSTYNDEDLRRRKMTSMLSSASLRWGTGGGGVHRRKNKSCQYGVASGVDRDETVGAGAEGRSPSSYLNLTVTTPDVHHRGGGGIPGLGRVLSVASPQSDYSSTPHSPLARPSLDSTVRKMTMRLGEYSDRDGKEALETVISHCLRILFIFIGIDVAWERPYLSARSPALCAKNVELLDSVKFPQTCMNLIRFCTPDDEAEEPTPWEYSCANRVIDILLAICRVRPHFCRLFQEAQITTLFASYLRLRFFQSDEYYTCENILCLLRRIMSPERGVHVPNREAQIKVFELLEANNLLEIDDSKISSLSPLSTSLSPDTPKAPPSVFSLNSITDGESVVTEKGSIAGGNEEDGVDENGDKKYVEKEAKSIDVGSTRKSTDDDDDRKDKPSTWDITPGVVREGEDATRPASASVWFTDNTSAPTPPMFKHLSAPLPKTTATANPTLSLSSIHPYSLMKPLEAYFHRPAPSSSPEGREGGADDASVFSFNPSARSRDMIMEFVSEITRFELQRNDVKKKAAARLAASTSLSQGTAMAQLNTAASSLGAIKMELRCGIDKDHIPSSQTHRHSTKNQNKKKNNNEKKTNSDESPQPQTPPVLASGSSEPHPLVRWSTGLTSRIRTRVKRFTTGYSPLVRYGGGGVKNGRYNVRGERKSRKGNNRRLAYNDDDDDDDLKQNAGILGTPPQSKKLSQSTGVASTPSGDRPKRRPAPLELNTLKSRERGGGGEEYGSSSTIASAQLKLFERSWGPWRMNLEKALNTPSSVGISDYDVHRCRARCYSILARVKRCQHEFRMWYEGHYEEVVEIFARLYNVGLKDTRRRWVLQGLGTGDSEGGANTILNSDGSKRLEWAEAWSQITHAFSAKDKLRNKTEQSEELWVSKVDVAMAPYQPGGAIRSYLIWKRKVGFADVSQHMIENLSLVGEYGFYTEKPVVFNLSRKQRAFNTEAFQFLKLLAVTGEGKYPRAEMKAQKRFSAERILAVLNSSRLPTYPYNRVSSGGKAEEMEGKGADEHRLKHLHSHQEYKDTKRLVIWVKKGLLRLLEDMFFNTSQKSVSQRTKSKISKLLKKEEKRRILHRRRVEKNKRIKRNEIVNAGVSTRSNHAGRGVGNVRGNDGVATDAPSQSLAAALTCVSDFEANVQKQGILKIAEDLHSDLKRVVEQAEGTDQLTAANQQQRYPPEDILGSVQDILSHIAWPGSGTMEMKGDDKAPQESSSMPWWRRMCSCCCNTEKPRKDMNTARKGGTGRKGKTCQSKSQQLSQMNKQKTTQHLFERESEWRILGFFGAVFKAIIATMTLIIISLFFFLGLLALVICGCFFIGVKRGARFIGGYWIGEEGRGWVLNSLLFPWELGCILFVGLTTLIWGPFYVVIKVIWTIVTKANCSCCLRGRNNNRSAMVAGAGGGGRYKELIGQNENYQLLTDGNSISEQSVTIAGRPRAQRSQTIRNGELVSREQKVTSARPPLHKKGGDKAKGYCKGRLVEVKGKLYCNKCHLSHIRPLLCLIEKSVEETQRHVVSSLHNRCFIEQQIRIQEAFNNNNAVDNGLHAPSFALQTSSVMSPIAGRASATAIKLDEDANRMPRVTSSSLALAMMRHGGKLMTHQQQQQREDDDYYEMTIMFDSIYSLIKTQREGVSLILYQAIIRMLEQFMRHNRSRPLSKVFSKHRSPIADTHNVVMMTLMATEFKFAKLSLTMIMDSFDLHGRKTRKGTMTSLGLRMANCLLNTGDALIQMEFLSLMQSDEDHRVLAVLKDILQDFSRNIRVHKDQSTTMNLQHDPDEVHMLELALGFMYRLCMGGNGGDAADYLRDQEGDRDHNLVSEVTWFIAVTHGELVDTVINSETTATLQSTSLQLMRNALRVLSEVCYGPNTSNQNLIGTQPHLLDACYEMLRMCLMKYLKIGFPETSMKKKMKTGDGDHCHKCSAKDNSDNDDGDDDDDEGMEDDGNMLKNKYPPRSDATIETAPTTGTADFEIVSTAVGATPAVTAKDDMYSKDLRLEVSKPTMTPQTPTRKGIEMYEMKSSPHNGYGGGYRGGRDGSTPPGRMGTSNTPRRTRAPSRADNRRRQKKKKKLLEMKRKEKEELRYQLHDLELHIMRLLRSVIDGQNAKTIAFQASLLNKDSISAQREAAARSRPGSRLTPIRTVYNLLSFHSECQKQALLEKDSADIKSLTQSKHLDLILEHFAYLTTVVEASDKSKVKNVSTYLSRWKQKVSEWKYNPKIEPQYYLEQMLMQCEVKLNNGHHERNERVFFLKPWFFTLGETGSAVEMKRQIRDSCVRIGEKRHDKRIIDLMQKSAQLWKISEFHNVRMPNFLRNFGFEEHEKNVVQMTHFLRGHFDELWIITYCVVLIINGLLISWGTTDTVQDEFFEFRILGRLCLMCYLANFVTKERGGAALSRLLLESTATCRLGFDGIQLIGSDEEKKGCYPYSLVFRLLSFFHLGFATLMVVSWGLSNGLANYYEEPPTTNVGNGKATAIPVGFALDKMRLRQNNESFVQKLRRYTTLTRRALGLSMIKYYVVYGIFAILAAVHTPMWNAFHLVDIITYSSHLKDILLVTNRHYLRLLATVFMGLIFVYGFAVIIFVFFSDQIVYNVDDDLVFMCDTLWGCVQRAVDLGFRNTPVFTRDPVPVITPLFNLIYFLTINTILVSIITGIIIDTFAEMRETRDQVLEEVTTKCVICRKGHHAFDQSRNHKGFIHHITVEHSIWAYVYLKYHILAKANYSPETLSNVELFVAKVLLEGDSKLWRIIPLHETMHLKDDSKNKSNDDGSSSSDEEEE